MPLHAFSSEIFEISKLCYGETQKNGNQYNMSGCVSKLMELMPGTTKTYFFKKKLKVLALVPLHPFFDIRSKVSLRTCAYFNDFVAL